MSLIQSAKLCGHEPYRYLKDVLHAPTDPAGESDRRADASSLGAASVYALNQIFPWQNVLAADRPRTSDTRDGPRTSPLQNIEWLIGDGGGAIHVGRVGSIECVASAADNHLCYAMLARRDGETLLQRATSPGQVDWT